VKEPLAHTLCSGHYNQQWKGEELRPLRIFSRVIDGMKVCSTCKQNLPVADFHKKLGDPIPNCKSCRSIELRAQTYGITKAEVVELLKRPCEGCGVEVSGKGQHIDHCHESNAVRGVLCSSCNTILGAAKDRPETLRRLAEYLERF